MKGHMSKWEREPERNRYRRIGAWEMDIGQMEEQKTGWRATLGIGNLTQTYKIRIPGEPKEHTLSIRTSDWVKLNNIERTIKELAYATGAIHTQHGSSKFAADMETKRLTKELKSQGVRLPRWLFQQGWEGWE